MARFAQGKYSLPKQPEKYIGTKSPTYRSSWEFHFMHFVMNILVYQMGK